MTRSFFIITLLFSDAVFGQEKPEVYKSFWNNNDKFIINHLVLSSDSLFFSLSSCECGKEFYGKGTWRMKGNTLYLYGFDSTKAYPNSSVKLINGEPSDSVIITAYDYFNNPMKDLILGLIYNDTTKFETSYEFADSLGRIMVSKNKFGGFYLLYEARGENIWIKDKNPYYTFEKKTNEVIINIDFAQAALDRQPVPFNFGIQKLKIKQGNLYSESGKLIYIPEKL